MLNRLMIIKGFIAITLMNFMGPSYSAEAFFKDAELKFIFEQPNDVFSKFSHESLSGGDTKTEVELKRLAQTFSCVRRKLEKMDKTIKSDYNFTLSQNRWKEIKLDGCEQEKLAKIMDIFLQNPDCSLIRQLVPMKNSAAQNMMFLSERFFPKPTRMCHHDTFMFEGAPLSTESIIKEEREYAERIGCRIGQAIEIVKRAQKKIDIDQVTSDQWEPQTEDDNLLVTRTMCKVFAMIRGNNKDEDVLIDGVKPTSRYDFAT